MKFSRHKIFNTFASRLGLYNGLIYQSKSHLTEIQRIKKDSKGKLGFYMGTKLIIKNYLKGKHEFLHTYTVTKRNISSTIEIFNMQFSNFCISQCFEAFETFLKDIVAYKIHKTKVSVLKEPALKGKSFIACRENLNESCRQKNKNNKKLFKLIKELSLPSFPELDFMMNQFSEWYIVLAETRHAIVHSNGMLKVSKTSDWTKYQRNVLETFLIKKRQGDFYVINCFTDGQKIIETIATHAQLIYDRLNISNEKGSS